MDNSKTTGFVAGLGLVVAVVALVLTFTSSRGLGGSVIENLQTDFVNGLKVAGDLVLSADLLSIDDVTVADDLNVSGDTVVKEFTQGGGITTLTDANGGTYTLTEAELLTSSVLNFAAGGAGQAVIALALPATSTLTSLLPTAGDMRTWVYDASALAAATTTTWTAGTGIDLIAYTTNDDVIDGGEYSQLTCWRQADTDVSCIVSELVASD